VSATGSWAGLAATCSSSSIDVINTLEGLSNFSLVWHQGQQEHGQPWDNDAAKQRTTKAKRLNEVL